MPSVHSNYACERTFYAADARCPGPRSFPLPGAIRGGGHISLHVRAHARNLAVSRGGAAQATQPHTTADRSIDQPAEGVSVPLVTVNVPEGTFSLAQKQKVVSGITDLLVEIEQVEDVRPYVTVLVNEIADGGWGVAGNVFTAKALADNFGVGPK